MLKHTFTASAGNTSITDLEINVPAARLLITTDHSSFDGVKVKTRTLGTNEEHPRKIDGIPQNFFNEYFSMAEGFLMKNNTQAGYDGFKTLGVIPITKSGITVPFGGSIRYAVTLEGLEPDATYKIHVVETFERYDDYFEALEDLTKVKYDNIQSGDDMQTVGLEDYFQIGIKVSDFKQLDLTIPGRKTPFIMDHMSCLLAHISENDIVSTTDAGALYGVGEYFILNTASAVTAQLFAEHDNGVKYFLVS